MIWALAFAGGCAVVLALCRALANPRELRTAWVLVAGFALTVTGQLLTGQSAPWLWFLAADAMCAMAVLHPPASRVQAWIGSIYVLQVILHVAFGVADNPIGARLYLDCLAAAGWLQLLILATGVLYHGGRRAAAAARSGGGVGANLASAHRAGLDEWP